MGIPVMSLRVLAGTCGGQVPRRSPCPELCPVAYVLAELALDTAIPVWPGSDGVCSRPVLGWGLPFPPGRAWGGRGLWECELLLCKQPVTHHTAMPGGSEPSCADVLWP